MSLDFVAFDLETTGIEADLHSIVEIGAVRFRDGEPGETFGTLVDPERDIPYEASQVSGITTEMVKGQPKIQDVLNDFATFCGDDILVAHNAKFDYKFVCNAIKKHGSKAGTGCLLDSYGLAKTVVSGISNHRLDMLVNHFEITATVFHRAEADAAYCGLVFARIVRALQRSGEACDVQALMKLADQKEMKLPQVPQSSQEQLGLF